MHWYKKNIGDYHKKAGRLSMLEHGAYTLLMDSCYDRERFPTEDEAFDWCWARTDEEKAAVRFVLSKFFTLIDGKYVQLRIQEEVESYHQKAAKNADIARKREQNRTKRARTVDEPSPKQHEAPPNQEPITSNQEPVTKNKNTPQAAKADKSARTVTQEQLVSVHAVDPQVAVDYLAIRKAKRAPLTATAFAKLQAEFDKAGLSVPDGIRLCAERGWQGFEAKWLDGKQSKADLMEQREREAMDWASEGTEKNMGEARRA